MLLIIFAAARLHNFHENSGRWVRLSIHGALAYSLMFAMLMSMIIEINGPQLYYFAGKINKQEYLMRTVASYPVRRLPVSQSSSRSSDLGNDESGEGLSRQP